jgi:predicted metal-binding transcription factor (methanogenesis marker protein 9)
MFEEESDQEGSVVSLDGSLSLEGSATAATHSSLHKYKHLYPEICVFEHNELMEQEDDMEIFAHIIPINSKPANVKSVMQMLMNFACCKVFEGIKLNVARTDTKSLWLHYHNEFRAFISNYPSTVEAHDFVLAKFPDKTWPPNFANFCLNTMFKPPSKAMMKQIKDSDKMSEEQLKALMLGGIVEEQAKKSIQDINNLLNPKWQKLPSGCTNYTPLFKYLRKCLWHSIALKKAQDNVKNALQTNASKKVTLTPEFTKEDFLEERYLFAMQQCEQEWGYPTCWISFLFLGPPALATIGRVSPSFALGIPEVNVTQGLGPLEAVQRVGSKEARKAFHATVQGKRPPPSKESGDRKRSRYATPSSASSSPSSNVAELSKLQVVICNLKDLITLMPQMGCTEAEILVQKKKLMKALMKSSEFATSTLDTVDLTADSDTEEVDI